MRTLILLSLVVFGAGHMSVSPDSIPEAGGYGSIKFRVPHGCGVDQADGSRLYFPTEAVVVSVPAVIAKAAAAKPETISFWPATTFDEEDGSRTITWAAEGPEHFLSVDDVMEFGLTFKAPSIAEANVMAFTFPATQKCHDQFEQPIETNWDHEDAPMLIYEGHDHMRHHGH
mmetsp:Transcript_22142/g.61467  ORF Transcript_22142/g.61467 Transcript_22142/m.61467 type:complete len:172 (-) Transcript_22142:238-753(-)